MAGLAGGRYITFGKPYVHMLAALIKDKKKVTFTDGKSELVEITPDVKKFLQAAEKSNEAGVAKILKAGVKFSAIFNGRRWTEVDKKQFTGKGGGAGAYVTKLTESLQCYYCAYIFNIAKRPLNSVSPDQLQKAERFVDTDAKLDECLKKGPVDWIESGVYTKTANAIHAKYKTALAGASYWHRGSQFMRSIYKSKGNVHKLDKATGNPQAPGSFSDDKWNPGDIWATTVAPSVKPFANHEDSWGELNNAVLGKAGVGAGAKTTLLAVSLKKIGPNAPAKVEEFNKTRPASALYKHKSFSYGRTGDFFAAIDAYIITSEGSVQFRNFSGEISWQGEIKGKAASGGKIGGANVAFYLEDVFKKKLYGRHGSERGVIAAAKNDPKHAMAMYDLYAKHNAKSSPHKPLLTSDEFVEKWNSATQSFRNSKTLCLYLIDILMSGSVADRDLFTTKMFRYAQSNTDQSSYFIKVY